jgi:hypothetical protein
LQSLDIDIFPIIAQGMGSELHWFPGDVSRLELAVVMVGMANPIWGRFISESSRVQMKSLE